MMLKALALGPVSNEEGRLSSLTLPGKQGEKPAANSEYANMQM